MSPAEREPQGAARAGSQLQLQIYVNRRPEELNAGLVDCLPSLSEEKPELEWRSPLKSDQYAEYRDAAFLEQVGCAELAPFLAEFWPSRGPRWDGLAIAHLASGEDGIVLVEAKSYPDEMYGPGGKAGESGSDSAIANRNQIVSALQATQEWLGMDAADGEHWMGRVEEERGSLYQAANRLAHLYWLREALPQSKRRRAWLANVLFVEDPTHQPTSRDEWERELPLIWRLLGLAKEPSFVGHVFVPGREPGELPAA